MAQSERMPSARRKDSTHPRQIRTAHYTTLHLAVVDKLIEGFPLSRGVHVTEMLVEVGRSLILMLTRVTIPVLSPIQLSHRTFLNESVIVLCPEPEERVVVEILATATIRSVLTGQVIGFLASTCQLTCMNSVSTVHAATVMGQQLMTARGTKAA